MKRILFVIHRMGMGGAEKSLISLLECLPQDRWEIDLIVASPYGEHMSEIPAYVHLLKRDRGLYEFENLSVPFSKRTKKISGLGELWRQLRWKLAGRRNSMELNHSERRWQGWGKDIPGLKKEYDLAISYMDGLCNYYVIDKVKAKRKILWVHNEFAKLGYHQDYEKNYFEKADAIVTISQSCAQDIQRVFPEYADKLVVLENISAAGSIYKLAQQRIGDSYFAFSGSKLLSIGRLSPQKNFELAIRAAKCMKEQGAAFLWYILGEGELRQKLTREIEEAGVSDCVKLAGERSNPYPYLAACDVFVQSSQYEGKSIALDEAKILHKPIVVTNYTTVVNSITDGVNGSIVPMDASEMAKAILRLLQDKSLAAAYSAELAGEKAGNEEEVEKYIALFEKMLEEGP